MVEPVAWKNFPDTSTPLTAEVLLQQQQWVLEQRAAAEDSAAAAAASAAEAAAPADDQIAGLVGTAGTATRTQLDARYATTTAVSAKASTAYVDTAISTLQGSAASIDDLFATSVLIPMVATITSTRGFPLFIAPYDLSLTSLAFTQWENPVSAASDTNYWTATLRVYDADGSTFKTVATKTTKVTGGQAIPLRTPWVFDASLFTSPSVAAGKMVAVAFAGSGTPPTITGPFIATVGYRPL